MSDLAPDVADADAETGWRAARGAAADRWSAPSMRVVLVAAGAMIAAWLAFRLA